MYWFRTILFQREDNQMQVSIRFDRSNEQFQVVINLDYSVKIDVANILWHKDCITCVQIL